MASQVSPVAIESVAGVVLEFVVDFGRDGLIEVVLMVAGGGDVEVFTNEFLCDKESINCGFWS